MLLLMISSSISFLLASTPMSMGLTLLIHTTLTALVIGQLSNFWFSYIMFLIMVGGMMVLFIYMTSITSNNKFLFSMEMSIVMVIMFMIIMWQNMSPMLNQEIIYPLEEYSKFSFMLNKFLMEPLNWIYIFLINYLLITLIAVVKISNIKYGPLRKK
nr:NADH dehydrogenase subunit 6 [Dromaeolus sp. ZM-2022]